MNLQYHIHKSSIKCPYCDCECHDDDYTIDQDRSEFECDRLHHEITEILVYSIYRYAYSKYAETANEINELNEEAKYRYRNDNFFHHAINTITAQIIDAINKSHRRSQK